METNSGDGSRSMVREILVCGGLSRNQTFLQCQANIVSLPVCISTEDDPVLIGAAMLAASAVKHHPTALQDAVTMMASNARTIHPSVQLKS